MKYTLEQLNEIKHNLQFLLGQQITYKNENIIVSSIEVEHDQLNIYSNRQDYPVKFRMSLEELMEYNPEYSHNLPK